MRCTHRALLCFVFLAAPQARGLMRGAETGDFDGDGRLSIGDVVHHLSGLEAAPGSLDAFVAHPCASWWGAVAGPMTRAAGITYLESLRRAVPDSLPHWDPLWGNEAIAVPPLPVSGSVTVEILDATAPGGDDDRLRLALVLTALEPIRAMSLILESESGILRVPYRFSPGRTFEPDRDWRETYELRRVLDPDSPGDLPVEVGFAPYLITNGRYVLKYGLKPPFFGQRGVEAGVHLLDSEVRLPRGTAAGKYGVSLHAGSEVLLADGRLVAPLSPREATILVRNEVRVGWDGGVPPLAFDIENQSLAGKLEFRVTDAVGLPGEPVSVRVQMRTEVPLNGIFLEIPYRPGGILGCLNGLEITNLFHDPDDGRPYAPFDEPGILVHGCTDSVGGVAPYVKVHYGMPGGDYPSRSSSHPDRVLDYFKPLGEWVDLVQVDFQIDASATIGIEVEFPILAYDPGGAQMDALWRPFPAFLPYGIEYPCPAENQPGRGNWGYDFVLHPGRICVLGEHDACGELPPAFQRGDGNADGNVDLSDALTTLNFLFLGGNRPRCMDAADTNDSGGLELTDAVFLLNSLFLNAGPLPPPTPGCGSDPQEDALGCAESRC